MEIHEDKGVNEVSERYGGKKKGFNLLFIDLENKREKKAIEIHENEGGVNEISESS